MDEFIWLTTRSFESSLQIVAGPEYKPVPPPPNSRSPSGAYILEMP